MWMFDRILVVYSFIHINTQTHLLKYLILKKEFVFISFFSPLQNCIFIKLFKMLYYFLNQKQREKFTLCEWVFFCFFFITFFLFSKNTKRNSIALFVLTQGIKLKEKWNWIGTNFQFPHNLLVKEFLKWTYM